VPKPLKIILNPVKGATLIFVALFLAVSWLVPLLVPSADASQLTTRSLTLSSGVPGATNTSYTFTFTIGASSTTPIKGLKFLACDSAFGTYEFF
jgi:hypothetical protein